MKNKYKSPTVEIYNYITEDVMVKSFSQNNTVTFPWEWIDWGNGN